MRDINKEEKQESIEETKEEIVGTSNSDSKEQDKEQTIEEKLIETEEK